MANKTIGKIYCIKIVDETDGLDKSNSKLGYYIGSTSQKLVNRLSGHVSDMNGGSKLKIHTMMNRTNSNDKIKYRIKKMETIYGPNKDDKLKLRMRERYYYDVYKNKYGDKLLNKNRPYISDEEKSNYYRDNKDRISQFMKRYYADNRDRLKSQVLEYYKNNREYKINYQKAYYQTNKAKITEKILAKRTRITCSDCQAEIWSNQVNNHRKTAKHQKSLTKE